VAREEPAESSPLDRQRESLFHAIEDACLLRHEEKAFTTEVPYTYFLQAGKDGPIKIGSSRNLLVRLRTLVTILPVPLTLLGVMEGDHEEPCHTLLGAFRSHGEWFAPSDTVLEFIRANAITPPPDGKAVLRIRDEVGRR
jgi:hypothetical protein